MAEAGPESRDSLQQQQPRLERKRVPLSEQPVGEMKIDRSIQLYREDIVRNGKARLEAVRETTEAKDLIHRLYSAPDFTQVESPWTCSRSRPPDRDPTPNKVLANKDTTVGTKLDLEGMRHYRTKLSDIWTAAYNNELEEVNLYLSCGADPNTRNSMVRQLNVWVAVVARFPMLELKNKRCKLLSDLTQCLVGVHTMA